MWIKKGLILEPRPEIYWLQKRVSLPFAFPLGETSNHRVYFYGQSIDNRSRVGYIEVSMDAPQRILKLAREPILDLGSLGAFDDAGVMPSWVVKKGNETLLFYTGWSLGRSVPFYFYIGLATSSDGGITFERYSKSPILGRDRVDPYLTASPCVMFQDGTWKMWYVSCIGWKLENGLPKHYYHVKYATSEDCISWKREGIVCIDFKDPGEYAIARPSVIYDEGIFKMWYSYRGEKYRIGYAESEDGIQWKRMDEKAGIEPSTSGWDSEMICYSHVFSHKGKLMMLYAGNNYGDSGFGYAIMQ